MKKIVSEIIGNIDDKYINEAALYTGNEKVRHRGLIKWTAVAACLAAVLFAGSFVMLSKLKDSEDAVLPNDTANIVVIGGVERPYKNESMVESESSAVVWQWEYLTAYEQYGYVTVNGKEYASKMREVGESLLGDMIGSYEAEGHDEYTGKTYQRTVEVRSIQGVSQELMLAVNLDGRYYVFSNSKYDPPATFGELTDGYDLQNTLRFEHFTVCEGYDEKGQYILKDGGLIWQTLSACRDAQFVEDDFWDLSGKNYVSFTVTSEALGVYKKVFYVSDDGYILTNIFDWGYVYNIGKDAAGQIISDAMENASEAEAEPYVNCLAGTVTEIRDDCFLVDDSVLCADKNDGMVFKVMTDDLRVSRYVDSNIIETGDVIRIEFTGDIDVNAGNVIKEVYSISRAVIYDGDVAVAE